MTDKLNDMDLPDVTETEILDAAATKKLGATEKTQTYAWRIVGVTNDVSDPEGSGKGWMMHILDAMALVPVRDPNGVITEFKPSSFKTKRWVMIPRTPSKAILLQRGYTDEQAEKVLKDFNPDGGNNFVLNNYRSLLRATFPESFPQYPGFKDGVWVSYGTDGSVNMLGTGDKAKAEANAIKQTLIKEIKLAAGNFWKDPTPLKGKQFYDGYFYEEKEDGSSEEWGKLRGFPTATPRKDKETGVEVEVLDPTKNIKKD